VASQFSFLAGAIMIDSLVAVAEKFASEGGWPQGWAGARGALREAVGANQEDDVVKLRALEVKLRPGSLSDRVASYVLPPEWGALDVAEVDFSDEKKYEKAQKQIVQICQGIGSE